MEMLFSLWLPILVCTVALFFASFLAWTVLPHHKPDYKPWPDEDGLLEYVRGSNAAPGEYMFPWCSDSASLKDPDVQRKMAAGPWGLLNLYGGQANMGMNMVKTIAALLVITFFIAYVGAAALPAGASFSEVFRIVGTTAILAHTAGGICREIWFTRPFRGKVMDFLDGLVYGVITGVIFGLLWP